MIQSNFLLLIIPLILPPIIPIILPIIPLPRLQKVSHRCPSARRASFPDAYDFSTPHRIDFAYQSILNKV